MLSGLLTRISASRGLDGVFAYVRVADSHEGVDFRARVYAPVLQRFQSTPSWRLGKSDPPVGWSA